MKKNVVASLAAAMILGISGSVFAAENPYVDVPAKHWAYDSVMKLSQAGLVDGYGDGKFQGDKTITRYEMAQVIAKAMAKSDKADASQKAEINKLVTEFSEELKTVGVRLNTLEKNQPNLKFNGAMLLRYNIKEYPNDSTKSDNVAGYYRLRLDGKAVVDEKTTFNFRYVTADPAKSGAAGLTNNGLPGKTSSTSKFGAEGTENANAGFDRYNITSKVGVFTATIGRQALVVGTTNGIVDSGTYSFDGLSLTVPLGQVNAVVNHGRLINQKDINSIQLSTKNGKLSYGGGYFSLQDNASGIPAYNGTLLGKDMLKLWYGNATYKFSSTFSMTAEIGQNKANYATNDNDFSNIWAIYGDQVLDAKGKNNVKLQYWVVGKNALALDSSGKGLTNLDTTGFGNGRKLSGYDLSYNYAFSKNLSSDVHYVAVKNNDVSNAKNYNYFRVNVNAKF